LDTNDHSHTPSTNDVVNFKARVKLCLEDSKEHKGWCTGVRPNHRIVGRNQFFVGQLVFIDSTWVAPGDCVDAIGSFLIHPSDAATLTIGTSWLVYDEPRRVAGTAKLLEILKR